MLKGLQGETNIAVLWRQEAIPSNLYYRWSNNFLEAGKQHLVGDTERQAESRQVNEMRAELEQLKQPVAELSLKNRVLKRSLLGKEPLMAKLVCGSGLRLMECLRLRVKDVDFAKRQITVRDGKGLKDRVTMLPALLRSSGAPPGRPPSARHQPTARPRRHPPGAPSTVNFLPPTRPGSANTSSPPPPFAPSDPAILGTCHHPGAGVQHPNGTRNRLGVRGLTKWGIIQPGRGSSLMIV